MAGGARRKQAGPVCERGWPESGRERRHRDLWGGLGSGLSLPGLVPHRVAGPLYQISRYLEVLGEGRYPDVRPLRKRDELHDFFEVFSNTIEALREHERVHLERIEQAIVLSRDDPDRVQATLEELREELTSALSTEGTNVEESA